MLWIGVYVAETQGKINFILVVKHDNGIVKYVTLNEILINIENSFETDL